MKKAFILLSLFLLTSCGTAGQLQSQYQQAAQREKAATDAAKPQFDACINRYFKGERLMQEKAVEFETCRQAVIKQYVLPQAVFPDLLSKELAANKKTAIAYKNGKIDRDEANLQLEQSRAEYIAQMQARFERNMNQAMQYDAQVAQQRQQYFQNLSYQLNQSAIQQATQCDAIDIAPIASPGCKNICINGQWAEVCG